MLPVEVAERLWWVGALDPQLRVFDVIMQAPRGTTYNAYLVCGQEKTVLIELVKAPFAEELVENLQRLIDLSELDFVVLNHTEPDHSGALEAVLEAAPGAQVVCSRNAKRFVEGLLNRDCQPLIVDDETEIDLGGRKLKFIIAPFLHWPDTMFTYLEPEGVLFPCDFLGAHYCDDRLFNDRVADYSYEFKYYFDVIMRPFKEHVLKALGRIEALEVKMICPSHGPIIRRDVQRYLGLYRQWASQPQPGERKKLLVFYASSYGNTARMAREIAAGAEEEGMEVAVFDVGAIQPEQVIDAIEAADAIAVGSITINGDAVKPVWDLLSSLATLNLRGKAAAAFGSYGWSGEGPKLIAQRLGDLKMKVIAEPLRVQLVPTEEDLAACRELGRQIARSAK